MKTKLKKLRTWSSFLCLALASSLLLVRPSVSSAASSWTGNSDSFWTNALNWGGNTLPSAGTDIIFTDTVNQTVELGANQTIGALNFFAADPYILNSFTLTLGGNLSQFLNGAVTINSGLDNGGSARTFNNSGTGEVTINGLITGAGAFTNASGNFTLGNSTNANSGGINVNGGRLTLSSAAGLNLNSAAGASQVGTGAININSGQLRLLPGAASTVGDIGRTVNFGATGGTLTYAGNPGNGAALSLNVTSASGTPGTVINGTANIGTGGAGWSSTASSVNLNSLIGGGTARFQFTNGAMLRFNTTSTTNAVIFSGHASGNVFTGATNTTVGRLLLPGGATNTISAGLTFQNFNHVTVDGGINTLDANLTINSGATAFAGGGSATDTTRTLSLGQPTGNRTLTIQTGGTAVFDLQNRADTAFQGGVAVNTTNVINAGGTLSIARTMATNYNPAVTPAIGTITINRNIIGLGTAASESVMDLTKLTGTDINAVQYASTANLVVNGTGTGGLRVQGTSAAIDSFLTTTRIQGITGSGGVLTIAYSDNVSRTLSVDPAAPSNVRLGLDSQGGSTPTYTLGATTGDLNNWNGLAVKGATVNVGAAQTFAGALDVTGGILNVNGANLTFNGNANLNGGTISVASLRTVTAGQIIAGTGATLTGAGTFNSSGGSANIVRGTISPGSPGSSAGTLRFVGGLSILTNSAVLSFDLATPGVAGGVNDLIQSVGSLTLDGKLNVSALAGFGAGTYTLLTYSGTLTDNTLDVNSMPAGWVGSVSTAAPGQINLIVTVPEPTTYALMGLGLSVLLLARRVRRQKQ